MARKPNYGFERNARAKAKAAKREAKREAKLILKAEKQSAASTGESTVGAEDSAAPGEDSLESQD